MTTRTFNGFVNIYPGGGPHELAMIYGNREGLIALREAISAALVLDDIGDPARVFDTDGEGYEIHVACDETATTANMQMPSPTYFHCDADRQVNCSGDAALAAWMERK